MIVYFSKKTRLFLHEQVKSICVAKKRDENDFYMTIIGTQKTTVQ